MAKKILVIEDQKELAKLYATRLKAAGYDVTAAHDGQKGMEEVPRVNPDLIVTDLAMPGMPGNSIVRILKSSEQYRHIPIIMVSAFVQENMKSSVEIPADFYITKPFKAEALLEKVQELLAKQN